jgi:hypothetical protein
MNEQTAPMKGNYAGHERQCAATCKRTGSRCTKLAMKGGRVCRVHGGGAPQVKKSARERLEALVDPAINTLRTVIRTGLKTGDTPSAVRASLGILDRTGFHPSQAVELSGNDSKPLHIEEYISLLDHATIEEKRTILEILDRAEERRERGEKP